jgi:hypothetical protein
MGDKQGVLTVKVMCDGKDIGNARIDFNMVDV